MSIVITPLIQPAAAQAATPVVLQSGSVISARVQQVLTNNIVRIAIAGQSIDVLSQVPLQAGQTLQLAVSQTNDGTVRLAVVNPQDAAAAGQAPAQAANAAQDEKRYEALVEKQYVTAQQYDQVRTAAEAARATLAGSQAAVDQARLNLQYSSIRAPISGRTGSLLVREGNLVRANAQQLLVVINRIRPILARSSRDTASLRRQPRNREPLR